jgi:hypothetical protein
MAIGNVRDEDIAVDLRIFFEELPEHATFDIEFTLLSVVVDGGFVHDAFIALRYQSDDEVEKDN